MSWQLPVLTIKAPAGKLVIYSVLEYEERNI
jgi:hypothetical protein